MKNFTRQLVVVLLLLATAPFLQAQDIHFSQFFSSPLTLNPAMTGNINGSYRAAVTYRNQWATIPAPYSTVAASFDMNLLDCQLGSDNVGVGGMIFNDRSGDGVLNNVSGMLSVAYHKGLDREGRYRLGLGVQGGLTQKSVDFQKLVFENQIYDYQFVTSLPNGEQIQDNSFSYFDLRAGGIFSAAVTDEVNLYVGGGYYHITSPTESFLLENLTPTEEQKLGARTVFHGGASIYATDNFSISPSGIYMAQSGARTIVFGTAFGYHFSQNNRYRKGSRADDSGVYLGGWYRFDDAVVIMLGVDYQRFKFGFSYDVNISDLDVASNNQGAIELSLTYTGRAPECRKKSPIYCPRF